MGVCTSGNPVKFSDAVDMRRGRGEEKVAGIGWAESHSSEGGRALGDADWSHDTRAGRVAGAVDCRSEAQLVAGGRRGTPKVSRQDANG